MPAPAAIDTPAPSRAAPQHMSRWRTALILLAGVELVLLYAPTAQWLWERWTLSVWHNAHGALIPPVAAYLIYDEMKYRRGLPWGSSAWGLAFLVPALMLHAIDTGMHTQLLSAVSIWIALPGLALLTIGTARTKAIAFPLFFLAFALPIPLAFTEPIHWQLRQMVTAVISQTVPLLGTPIFVEGTSVQTAAGTVEIAEACSGFSTLYAAAAVAFLTAYSAPNNGRRALVLVAAAPIAFVANAVRVTGLVVLVASQGLDVLETFLHPLSGMLTFALALPIIFWLGGTNGAQTSAPREAHV